MTEASASDDAARHTIRDDLDATLFVEAAAGTGKTTELVTRMVRVLETGRTTLDRVVAVTFTEKAAGEMKLRLRAAIEKARAAAVDPAPAERLEAALERLELARIVTIHAFCADLLRERPVEAGVDPLFEVAPDDEREGLIDRAFDTWFQQILAAPGEGVRRILRRRAKGRDAVGPRQELRRAVTDLVERRDFPAPWRRDPIDREARIDAVMDTLAEVGALAAESHVADDWLRKNLEQIDRFVQENALLESLPDRRRDHDALEAGLRDLASKRTGWHWRGSPYAPFGTQSRADVIATRDGAKRALDELLRDLDADLAPLLQQELGEVVAAYEELKHRAGRLDFTDLLIRARDLIQTDRAVRAELQQRYTHFFVDEFQDTDPLQAEILLLLASDDPHRDDPEQVVPIPGKLFLVGDPKQSIYRFRRADVELYERIKRRLVDHGAKLVHLTRSFRAVPSLQHAVNAAFAPLMQGGGSQAGYVALQAHRAEPVQQPTLIALPVPRIYSDYGRVTNWTIDESFPEAVGALIDWLVTKSGFRVTDRDRPTEPVAVEPRHICLLLRRMVSFGDDVTRPYVRALEARRVPHVLVGGRSFHEREEVLALRNALVAIEWPDDELRVFATLRGPLFALPDEALLSYRERPRSSGDPARTTTIGRLHPLLDVDLDPLDAAEREVAAALAVLRRLHNGRNRRPIAHTLSTLLKEVRAHAGIAIWPTGEQSLANVLRIVDLAHRFERRGASSFRAFVERLEVDTERGGTPEAPAVEEGTDGVRIMTTHRAKGLEFPVVILVDPTCNATREQPSRYVDNARRLLAQPLCGCAPRELLEHAEAELQRDREEAVRVTYVAATRARDLLVVPVLGDVDANASRDTIQDWLDPLRAVLYPEPAQRRDSSPAAGCPQFGEDSVLERPESARRGTSFAVRPGLHRSRAGTPVVWWDPRALDLARDDHAIGLRQQRILQADDAGVCEQSTREHDAWMAARQDALTRGSEPSVRALTVTAAAHSDEPAPTGAEPAAVTVDHTDVARAARPHGVRFGNLVHATLADIALDADRTAVDALTHCHGRTLGATPDEVDAAAAAVLAALRHPVLQRAHKSGTARREAPILLRQQGGVLLEGSLDLAFREDGPTGPQWTVVDFKTDRDLTEPRAEYLRQVALYAQAVAIATGRPTRGLLLLV